jgi:ribosomal protein S19
MHKSKWKFPFVISEYLDIHKREVVQGIRSSIIPLSLYKNRVNIYNGKNFIKISVKKAMLGKKFGEFSITKVVGSRIIRKKKIKKKSRK